MNNVEIYSKENCVYCTRAKNLAKSLGFEYNEHLIGRDITRDEFLAMFPNAKTVPQIIINSKHIGGYEDFVKWREEVYDVGPERESFS